jgi:fatty-acyl-CoA synthase
MSYVCGTAEIALLGKCIGEVLDDTAAKYPEQDCLIVRHQNRRYSYRQFREEVEQAARGFLRLGVKKGDRVGIWPTNSAEWIITQFATAKVGAFWSTSIH